MADLPIAKPRFLSAEDVAHTLSSRQETQEAFGPEPELTPSPLADAAPVRETHPWWEAARRMALAAPDWLAAVGLYGISTLFSVRLFVERAGNDPLDQVVFGLLGAFFDLSKISLWVNGRRKNNGTYVGLALAFTLVSLIASTLNLFASFDAAVVEAKSDAYFIDAKRAEIALLEKQVAIENARLEKGDARYRTDAGDTRESIDRLAESRRVAVEELRALMARSDSSVAAKARGLFDVIPGSKETRDLIQVLFLALVSLLLEAGGLATTDSLVRRKP